MNQKLYWGLAIGFVINMIQGHFTAIHPDEAYYQLYGQNLDWGYFDHPPFVGISTYLSALLFEGHLGVRFITIILQTAVIGIIWSLIDIPSKNKNPLLTYGYLLLSASLVMFVAYGFITTPDVGLLFFSALFLKFYQSFLKKEKWNNTFGLAVAMSGMMYSKYHGGLFIVLVLLANGRLLKSLYFWIAGILALTLWMPHLYWQFQNDFPSITYHLVSRSQGFKWEYLLMYPVNQFLVYNPVIWILGWKILQKPPKNPDTFRKTLYYILWGFLSFFALSSLRGHVEPHWTVVISFPLLILLTDEMATNDVFLKRILKYVGYSFVLILIIRLLILTGLMPLSKKEKYMAIENLVNNSPVVFTGSFQNPSLYTYYTGQVSSVVSSLNSRLTQFDIYQKDTLFWGQKVFLEGCFSHLSNNYVTDNTEFNGYFISRYQSPHYLKIEPNEAIGTLSAKENNCISLTIHNPLDKKVEFNHEDIPLAFVIIILDKKKRRYFRMTVENLPDSIGPKATLDIKGCFMLNTLPEGSYKIAFCTESVFGEHLSSKVLKVNIK